MIEVVINPNQKEINEFETFANSNWGEHSHGEDLRSLEFFDLHRILFLNYKNKQLVSGFVCFPKTLIFKNEIIHIIGIGGVVTHKDQRRKGYAIETLRYSVEYFKERNIDALMLCTDIDKLGPLYMKAGFVALNMEYTFLDKNGKLKTEDSGMINTLSNNDLLNRITNSSEPLFLGRSNF